MDVTVRIEAPELVAAINTLATALETYNQGTIIKHTSAPAAPAFASPVQAATAPVLTTATAPALSIVPNVAPAQPAPTLVYSAPAPVAAAPESVPVTAPQTYTQEQLAVAATQLMDAGRQPELISLLAAFGVQALTQLPKEQYGNFATQLRAMGARI